MGISITTSTLTAEAEIAGDTTIRAFAEAAIMPVTDMRRRRADTLVTVHGAAVEFIAAGSTEVEAEVAVTVAVEAAEAASMVAVVGLEAEGAAGKGGRLLTSCAEW